MPLNKPRASLHLRSTALLSDWLCVSPLTDAFSLPTVLLPEPQPSQSHPLLLFGPRVFLGKRAAALPLGAPSCSCGTFPPISSPQQIQVTNLMLQLQKTKQLWKIEQVPWNKLLQWGLGGLQTDRRWGVRQNSLAQDWPTQPAQGSLLRALKNTDAPEAKQKRQKLWSF